VEDMAEPDPTVRGRSLDLSGELQTLPTVRAAPSGRSPCDVMLDCYWQHLWHTCIASMAAVAGRCFQKCMGMAEHVSRQLAVTAGRLPAKGAKHQR
jgi:hypothetical protein